MGIEEIREVKEIKENQEIEDLCIRFKKILVSLRNQIQPIIENYFKKNKNLRNYLLESLGLEKLIENGTPTLIIKERNNKNLWSIPSNRDKRLKLCFLSYIFKEGKDAWIFDRPKSNAPKDKQDWEKQITSFLASLYSIWIYFYDRASGSFYYPFADNNFVYGEILEETSDKKLNRVSIELSEEYRKILKPMLKNYLLRPGEGSNGLAIRCGRGLCLPSTLFDVRGSVALEDLFLRNFAYMGFPIGGITERFGEAPFAHIGIMFPLTQIFQENEKEEMGVNCGSNLCCSNIKKGKKIDCLYMRLEKFFENWIAVLENLVANIEDMASIYKMRQISQISTGQVSSVEEFLDSFTKKLSEMPEEWGVIRDPFGFKATHLIMKDFEDEKSLTTRRIWAAKDTLRSTISEQISSKLNGYAEIDDLPLGQESEEKRSFNSFMPWKSWNYECELEKVVDEIYRPIITKKYHVEYKEFETGLLNIPRIAILFNFKKKEINDEYIRKFCDLLKEFRNALDELKEIWEPIGNQLLRWIGTQKKHRSWKKFEEQIAVHKLIESIIQALATILFEEIIRPKEKPKENGKSSKKKNEELSFKESFKNFINWFGQKKLKKITDNFFKKIEDILEVPSAESGFLFSLNNINLKEVSGVNLNREEFYTVCQELTNPGTLRTLRFAVSYNDLIPGDDKKIKKIRISPQNNNLVKEDNIEILPIAYSAGKFKNHKNPEYYNLSFATALSENYIWRDLIEDPKSECPFNYIYLFTDKKNNLDYMMIGDDLEIEELKKVIGNSLDHNVLLGNLSNTSKKLFLTVWPKDARAQSWVLLHTNINEKFLSEELEEYIKENKYFELKKSVLGNSVSYDMNRTDLLNRKLQKESEFIFFSSNKDKDKNKEYIDQIISKKPEVINSDHFGESVWYFRIQKMEREEEPIKPDFIDKLFDYTDLNKKSKEMSQIFGINWGFLRHILWPVEIKTDEGREFGLLIFSTPQPKVFRRGKHKHLPAYLTSSQKILINTAVDYFEYWLSTMRSQMKHREDLENLNITLIHQLGNKLRSIFLIEKDERYWKVIKDGLDANRNEDFEQKRIFWEDIVKDKIKFIPKYLRFFENTYSKERELFLGTEGDLYDCLEKAYSDTDLAKSKLIKEKDEVKNKNENIYKDALGKLNTNKYYQDYSKKFPYFSLYTIMENLLSNVYWHGHKSIIDKVNFDLIKRRNKIWLNILITNWVRLNDQPRGGRGHQIIKDMCDIHFIGQGYPYIINHTKKIEKKKGGPWALMYNQSKEIIKIKLKEYYIYNILLCLSKGK